MSIGIDVGSKFIKIIELKKELNNTVLKSAGITATKGTTIEKMQEESEFIVLADILKKLVADAKVSSKEVYVSLPESLVFTRNVKLPTLTDQEIASAIKWQAEEIIPIPVKDAIFQHIILERRESAQPPDVSVLVVAAPRALVEKYVKVFSLAGLTIIGVETELLALTRAVSVPSQGTVIVDSGARSTDIAITKNGKLVFSRTLTTAGDAFTRSIAQTLNIDLTQAEEYKRTYGLAGDQLGGKISAAMLPILKIITEEIKKTIHFYQSEERENNPNLLVLTGGSAGIPEIIPSITKLVGIESVMANPFAKITVNPQVLEKLKAYMPLYSVAVGLAQKEWE